MARAKLHRPVVRFAALFGADTQILDQAVGQATGLWGELVLQTGDLDFDMTRYYERTMGRGLKKRLIAFRDLIDPIELVASKRQSNQWEQSFQERNPGGPERVLNLDPGYVTEAKVVLATMKDRDHRLYLGDGVYGEVTLYYQLPGKWEASRWTYPDYRCPEYHDFFTGCRDYLRTCLQAMPPAG